MENVQNFIGTGKHCSNAPKRQMLLTGKRSLALVFNVYFLFPYMKY